jgi:hypothetical protein
MGLRQAAAQFGEGLGRKIEAWAVFQLTNKKTKRITETECCLAALHCTKGRMGGIGNGKVGCVASEHQ